MSSSSPSSSRSSSPAASDVSASSAATADSAAQRLAAQRLAALEAHGAAFLSSFGLDAADLAAKQPAQEKGKGKKRRKLEKEEQRERERIEEPEEQEEPNDELQKAFSKADKRQKKLAKESANSTPAVNKGKARAVETVVFSGGSQRTTDDFAVASEGMKEFMSSKVKKPNAASSTSAGATKKRRRGANADSDSDEGGDEEKAAQANDKALSHLLSTTLFAPGTGQSVSSNKSKTNLSHRDTLSQLLELGAPASKRKGMTVGRGWGEAALKAEGMSKMPSAMRAGLRKAERQNVDKEVERAKELGTYHPSLKRHLGKRAGLELILGEGGKKDEKERRGREKGIKASIGRFRDGTLTLSKREIEKVNSGGGGRGGRGGSSGGRGGGGKRGGRR